MRSTAKRFVVVLMAMAMVVALPGVALAHHPEISAEPDCVLANGDYLVDFRATAWNDDATDLQRTNPNIGIYLDLSGDPVATGAFNVSNGFMFTGSFTVPAGTASPITVYARADAAWGSDHPAGDYRRTVVALPTEPCEEGLEGRMTGGGSFFLGEGRDKVRYTHGFELHCDHTDLPNNLQINWPGNRFHLTELTLAICTDDPAIAPHPPRAPFDTYYGEGIGRWNGVDGARIVFTLTDTGQPGRSDMATISITGAGGVVSNVLTFGNHQAHK